MKLDRSLASGTVMVSKGRDDWSKRSCSPSTETESRESCESQRGIWGPCLKCTQPAAPPHGSRRPGELGSGGWGVAGRSRRSGGGGSGSVGGWHVASFVWKRTQRRGDSTLCWVRSSHGILEAQHAVMVRGDCSPEQRMPNAV